jgi:6-phosphogluconate dehydrogenase
MGRTLCDIGMIGLGVMGRNLVLNMTDHGFATAGYDKSANQAAALQQEGRGKEVRVARTMQEFADLLDKPRAVMMLVPAGRAVDDVIDDIVPYLGEGDMLIDGGNSHFSDTDRRQRDLAQRKIHLLGVGISGGEEGARRGPSIMPGGDAEAYERVRPIFEAIAAKVGDEPCVQWMGPGAAGHFVKMVHNGIEYAIMELIAETYDMMKRGLGYTDDHLHEVYSEWNRGELHSYLLEITASIFTRRDDKTGQMLIDMILDEADQKGTGMWTTESTLAMHVPAPTIDMAVAMRDMSSYKNMRVQARQYLCGPQGFCPGDAEQLVGRLRNALHMGMILAYSQGMALLRTASDRFGYGLDLEVIARIWRGGCIIRSDLLESIRDAYRRRGDLPDLLADGKFVQQIEHLQQDLRGVIIEGAAGGIPLPGFGASLAYFDSYRSAWLPANLIQAQRDFFGSHTYRRIDMEGAFHTRWTEPGATV